MNENAKTNEFKEMVKAELGELSNEEIEKLKKFMGTIGDISEHHGNGVELSDEQLESVGGGLMTEEEFLAEFDKRLEQERKSGVNIPEKYEKEMREFGIKIIRGIKESRKNYKPNPTPQEDPIDEFIKAWSAAADNAYRNR